MPPISIWWIWSQHDFCIDIIISHYRPYCTDILIHIIPRVHSFFITHTHILRFLSRRLSYTRYFTRLLTSNLPADSLTWPERQAWNLVLTLKQSFEVVTLHVEWRKCEDTHLWHKTVFGHSATFMKVLYFNRYETYLFSAIIIEHTL